MTAPRARILVVDDEPVNRRLIDAILGPEGHELVHAGTGERALELVAQGGIDLVLLDVMMPGIDGIEVCRQIRADVQQRLLPVVIVSALADIESRTRGKEVGADDFLTKPIHHDELLARVRHLLLARASYMLSEEQRERAEVEARQWRARSEERHRILFEASPVPSWLFDPASLQILAVNEAMVRLFGYTRDELLAMRLPDLEHVDGLRYARKDRRVVELDITSQAMMLDGRPAMLAVGIDVTHSRRMEDQLRQAQKMEAIGQLAGGIAHDFNNILAAILANTDFARDAVGAGHAAIHDLAEIEKAAQRAVTLTRQLLTFSRQERRTVSVLSLNTVVTNVEKMLGRIVGENIEIGTVLADRQGTIEADESQLEQVLVNLVVNARDAMPTGGRLTIETANTDVDGHHASELGIMPGPYVVLAVSDSGCGMDAATRARIFEPFFTTKEVGKGTGLGLSTVFGIVVQSGGAISVYSEVGLGSTFRVYFPRSDRPADALAGHGQPEIEMGSGTVLVVEDDETLRTAIRRQLTSWGYTLLEAPNGAAALELLRSRREPIDLLLTDLVMPGIDGRALAHEVVAARPDTKVLFMSGYTEHAAVKTAALASSDHFIQKPFTGVTLSSALRRAMTK